MHLQHLSKSIFSHGVTVEITKQGICPITVENILAFENLARLTDI
jgi:hypothetical protein